MDKISYQCWYEKHAKIKSGSITVKLFKDSGEYFDAVKIPSGYWPLNGPMEVFHCKNTRKIEDSRVFEIMDSVTYQTGFCYTNSKAITEGLRKAGYDAKTYVGWLFCNSSEYPIHHAWTVLDGNVIDLSDMFWVADANRDKFDAATTKEEGEILYIQFAKWLESHPNHKRGIPGWPYPSLLYVGCPCSAEQGKMIYNRLVDTCPGHPCHSKAGADNMTNMQRKMKAAGCR